MERRRKALKWKRRIRAGKLSTENKRAESFWVHRICRQGEPSNVSHQTTKEIEKREMSYQIHKNVHIYTDIYEIQNLLMLIEQYENAILRVIQCM